jgi:hypothetical protein
MGEAMLMRSRPYPDPASTPRHAGRWQCAEPRVMHRQVVHPTTSEKRPQLRAAMPADSAVR